MSYKDTLTRIMQREDNDTTILVPLQGIKYTIVLGAYGLQVRHVDGWSECVHLLGLGRWCNDGDRKFPKTVENSLNSIANCFDSNEELRRFVESCFDD